MASKAVQQSWTQTQRDVFTDAQKTADTLVAYSAPELPMLGQGATAKELLEELGPLHTTSKRLEKVINIMKERMKPLCFEKKMEGDKEVEVPLKLVTSDNYKREVRKSTRVALNQGAAKDLLAQLNDYHPARLAAFLTLHQAALKEAGVFTRDVEHQVQDTPESEPRTITIHEAGCLDACMGSTDVEAVYIEHL